MAMGQKMQLTITGIQYPVGEAEGITTIQQVEAEYFQRNDSHYLLYEELPEGFPKPLKTRIKLKGRTLEIYRQGPGGSTLFFAEGTPYRTEYVTPYGKLLLDIVTLKLVVTGMDDAKGEHWPEVLIEYVLQNDGEDMAKYVLTIKAEGE